MSRCFVMQPFDGGAFDARYDDILAPAIRDAGLEPYRVDRDPTTSIPIEQIEAEIRAADVCVADITTDNPNVWYELGFAIAAEKEVVLICSKDRGAKFPFDVQHRFIIDYAATAPRDFLQLHQRLTERLKAIIDREKSIKHVAATSIGGLTKGLSAHEIAAVSLIAQATISMSLDDGPSTYSLQRDMNKAGFTDIATSLAVRSLLKMGFIDMHEAKDYEGDPYDAFHATDAGLEWLLSNQDKLQLRVDVP